MLELTPLVTNSARAERPDGTENRSPWKKMLMLLAVIGLIGLAVTQMPKMSSAVHQTSVEAKQAILISEPVVVRSDTGNKCGPKAASATPAHVFVSGRVIGCDGPFTGGLFSGEAADLCDSASGWRVCSSQNDAATQGLTKTLCGNAPGKKFFATQQRGKGFHKCEGTGANDVFGCGGKDLGLVPADSATCSPLLLTGGNKFGNYNGKQWSCAACNANGLDELEKVSHQLNGASSYDGGVMCCKSGPLQCPPGQYLASQKCHACPVGHKCSYNAKTMCPAGEYQPQTGQSTCKKAECGYFVPAKGATAQQACRPGTFSKAGASSCTPAPVGHYSGAAACFPVKCPPGSYQDCDGQSSCPKPPCGHYVPNPASTQTLPCQPGTFQPNPGQPSCLPTPPGHYSGKGHCKPRVCIPGFYQKLPKQSSCKPADCGHHVPNPKSLTQTPCGPGTYQPQTGQPSCLPVPAGYFATKNKCGIQCCPAGHYRDSKFTCKKADCGYYVPNKCMSHQLKCPPGTFSKGGAQTCTPAPAGSVPNPTQCGVDQCKPGTYQNKPGQKTCKDAPCGHKAPGFGNKNPVPCPPGFHQPNPKKTSCLPCNPGSANPKPGQCKCPLCLPGTFQKNSGQTSCKESPCGHFVKNPGSTKADACPPGQWQPKTKQTGCLNASPGYFAVGGKCYQSKCPVGTFSPKPGRAKCTNAPCGTYVALPGQSNPVDCKAGQYQPLAGQTKCLLAPTGSYTSGSRKCEETLCKPGYYQPLTGQTSCKPAKCGHYVAIVGASAQIPCGGGRYQPKPAQTSCLLADVGYFVVGPAACKQTQCPAGSYTDCKGQKYCLKAPCGHVVSNPGQGSYKPCPAGSYQDAVGQSTCKTNPAGSFSKAGYCKFQLCDPGTWQNLQGQTSCKKANCGKYVSIEGATAQSTCGPSTYQPLTGQTGCLPTTSLVAPVPGTCRKKPTYFKGTGAKKWKDAQAACKAAGGRLAIVKSASENAAAYAQCTSKRCWLGGSDQDTEKVWKWLDGHLLAGGYTNWAAGQPNNLKPGQDCLQFFNSPRWNDLECSRARDYVCEK